MTSRLTALLGTNPIRLSSHDLPFEGEAGATEQLRASDVRATDLSSAAFLAQARALEIEAAAIVVITAGPAGDLALAEADVACLQAGRVAADLLTVG